MRLEKSWEEIKKIVADKGLSLQFDETEDDYEVFAVEDGIQYRTIIYKDVIADEVQKDFESNFKITANSKINTFEDKVVTSLDEVVKLLTEISKSLAK